MKNGEKGRAHVPYLKITNPKTKYQTYRFIICVLDTMHTYIYMYTFQLKTRFLIIIYPNVKLFFVFRVL